MNTQNTFNNGLVLDTHPMSTPNNVLTNCLNGTLVTRNGNEMILQNDVGNSKIIYEGKEVSLSPGFIPVGLKEFGGILYIFSVNPNDFKEIEINEYLYDETNVNQFLRDGKYYENYFVSEIGTFPSPDYPKTSGKLINTYKPLLNFENGSFTTHLLNFDINHPLTIDCQKSYDGSINLIFTDNKNIPRLINTRFSLYGDNEYEIVDRSKDSDTNLYYSEDFEFDTSLQRIVNKIVNIQFDGVNLGGNMKVGQYVFYFSLLDADGNESDFIGLSGLVACYKGLLNDPFSVDGGVADENSFKQVRFTLSNFPKNYNRVLVYYSRNTCDETGIIITSYKKIQNEYKIVDNTCNIYITGYEDEVDSSFTDINNSYTSFEKSKALSINNNILFEGNITNANVKLYSILEKTSLNILGTWEQKDSIGHLTGKYIDDSNAENKNEYYNTDNIYNKVGYWPNEFYRFGIVYILNNYQLSPVFNIKGVINNKQNDYGIYRTTDLDVLSESKPISINFNVDCLQSILDKIKGFFFVRQKRIKTILALAMRIGYDKDYSRLPLLYGSLDLNGINTEGGDSVIISIKYEYGKYVLTSEISMKISMKYGLPTVVNYSSTNIEDLITYAKLNLQFNESEFSNIRKIIEGVNTENQKIEEYNLDEDESDIPVINLSDRFLDPVVCVHNLSKNTSTSKTEAITDWYTLGILSPNYDNYSKGRYTVQNTKITLYDIPIYRFDMKDLGGHGDGLYMEHIGLDSITKLLPTLLFRKFARENVEKAKGDTEFERIDKFKEPTTDALICPEFEINQNYYGSIFTGGKVNYRKIYTQKYNLENNLEHVYPSNIQKYSNPQIHDNVYVISVLEGQEAVKNKLNFYSSIAGNAGAIDRYKLPFTNCYTGFDVKVDDNKIDGLDMEGDLVDLSGLTRGIWGPYLGIEEYYTTSEGEDILIPSSKSNVYDILDILVPNYNSVVKNAESVRLNDNSEYYAITKRFDINNLENYNINAYNGDCYICNFTHRMNRNFTDPEFSITDEIADFKTLGKGLRFSLEGDFKKDIVTGIDNIALFVIPKTKAVRYTPALKFVNRSDLNAATMGQWVTVKVLSSQNLSLRSTDSSNISEKGITGNARSFYPLRKFDSSSNNKISDSYLFNQGYEKSTSDLVYIRQLEVPALKTNFSNRILYSDIAVKDAFVNNLRTFRKSAYQDYTRQYGEIVKLLNYKDSYILCVFEHAIALIEVNEKAVLTNASSGLAYIDTNKVISDKPYYLSTDFGSQWADSVIQTPTGVYGIDTVAKKVWRCYGTQFEVLSDFMIGKFLKDNLLVTEQETTPDLTKLNIKTHYNRRKQDVMFTFFRLKDEDYLAWNICYNEITKKWSTFYSWLPSYSGNINNTFYSFNNENSVVLPNVDKKEEVVSEEVNYYYDFYPNEYTQVTEPVVDNEDSYTFVINGLPLKMIKVKGGTFTDHYALDSKEVTVSDYWISEKLITNSLYNAITGENNGKADEQSNPASYITWYKVGDVIKLLNEKFGYTGDNEINGFSLPTHALWTWAAMGGVKSKGYIYPGGNDPDKIGWSKENSGSEVKDVGLKSPNELGLYDMGGNVWEWCSDGFTKRFSDSSTTDPFLPDYNNHGNAFIRGGSAYNTKEYMKITHSTGWLKKGSDNDLGFRLVCKKVPRASENTENKVETKTLTVNGVNFKMVKVKGGKFVNNISFKSVDRIETYPINLEVTDYWISETLVTRELFRAVLKNSDNNRVKNLINHYDEAYVDENISYLNPANMVALRYEIPVFLQELSRIIGKEFKVPTLGQWTWAAKGGVKSKNYLYAGSNDLDEVAWHRWNSNLVIHPVKLKKPNELGLYDMSGLVWEWCRDGATISLDYQDNGIDTEIPCDPHLDEGTRFIKGGSFLDHDKSIYEIDYTSGYQEASSSYITGFRIVCKNLDSITETNNDDLPISSNNLNITKTVLKTPAKLNVYFMSHGRKNITETLTGQDAINKYKELSGNTDIDSKSLDNFYKTEFVNKVITIYTSDSNNLLWEHNKENNWCNWYGEQHPFEFEFVIAENPLLHKILENLHIIANKTKPESFHFEIIGNVYNFKDDKQNMYYRLERTKELYNSLTGNLSYDKDYKNTPIKQNQLSTIFPLYVSRVDHRNKIYDSYLRMTSNSIDYLDMSGSEIVKDTVANEYDIATHIKAYPIDGYEWLPICPASELSNVNLLQKYYSSKGVETKLDDEYLYKKVRYGRRLGNCEYKEDLWKVQVPPINYIQVNEKPWSEPPICIMTNPVPEEISEQEIDVPTDTVCEYKVNSKLARIRDKYIKIKVRYDGKDLAIISAILSMYKESYS